MLTYFGKPSTLRITRNLIRNASRIHDPPPSFPVIQKCPAPTCDCSPTPAMPEGLPINHDKPLNNTFAFSNEQVVICTAQSDWTSKIEDEHGGDNLAADLKELVGGKGEYADPYHNISIINGSFPSSISPRPAVQSNSAYLFPSFKYIPFLPRVSFDAARALVKGYLQPIKLNAAHDILSPVHRDRLLRAPEFQSVLYGVEDVKDILVMICGHGGRDMRCGVMGPVLQDEFQKLLPKFGLKVDEGPVNVGIPANGSTVKETTGEGVDMESNGMTARVGMVSHIGGHAYAGNVICCIPPSAKLEDGNSHPLAGCQIWYGRIEPKHVEGVIVETLKHGRVLAEHFRGGIKHGGEVLRM